MILKNSKLLISFVAFSLCFHLSGRAQDYLSSPYSRFGWGEMQPRSTQKCQAMGGTAFAYRSPTCINSKNPASYSAFDSLSAVVDAAFSLRMHRLTEGSENQQGSTAFFDYFSFGLPVTSHWATALGIQPFSIVSYDYTRSSEAFSSSDWGDGGTYEIFWGNSLRFGSHFSVGLQASYLFGTSRRAHELVFSDDKCLNLRSMEEDAFGGFLFSTGMQCLLPVGKKLLGFGLAFTPSLPSCVHVDRSAYRLTYRFESALETTVDTLNWEGLLSQRLQVKNPAVLGFGLSWSEPDRFWVGADAEWTGWSRYAVGGTSDSLNDRMRFSAGAEWIPQSGGGSYLKRITYSAGLFYEKDYLNVAQTSFHRMGMDVGLAFPVKKNKSKIGVCLETGLFAPVGGEEGIREQYYRFTVHVQLHEKWYQHRKLD